MFLIFLRNSTTVLYRVSYKRNCEYVLQISLPSLSRACQVCTPLTSGLVKVIEGIFTISVIMTTPADADDGEVELSMISTAA